MFALFARTAVTTVSTALSTRSPDNRGISFADQVLLRKFGYPIKIRIPVQLGFENPKFVIALLFTNDYPGEV